MIADRRAVRATTRRAAGGYWTDDMLVSPDRVTRRRAADHCWLTSARDLAVFGAQDDARCPMASRDRAAPHATMWDACQQDRTGALNRLRMTEIRLRKHRSQIGYVPVLFPREHSSRGPGEAQQLETMFAWICTVAWPCQGLAEATRSVPSCGDAPEDEAHTWHCCSELLYAHAYQDSSSGWRRYCSRTSVVRSLARCSSARALSASSSSSSLSIGSKLM